MNNPTKEKLIAITNYVSKKSKNYPGLQLAKLIAGKYGKPETPSDERIDWLYGQLITITHNG